MRAKSFEKWTIFLRLARQLYCSYRLSPSNWVIYRDARPLSDDFSSLNMCFSDRESEWARDNLYQIESNNNKERNRLRYLCWKLTRLKLKPYLFRATRSFFSFCLVRQFRPNTCKSMLLCRWNMHLFVKTLLKWWIHVRYYLNYH